MKVIHESKIHEMIKCFECKKQKTLSEYFKNSIIKKPRQIGIVSRPIFYCNECNINLKID